MDYQIYFSDNINPLNEWNRLSLSLNSLPNDKILDWSKLIAFADNKTNVTEKLKFVLGRVENIVGKGENAGYQHLLPFSTMFSNGFFLKVVKSQECGKGLKYPRYHLSLLQGICNTGAHRVDPR